VDILEKYPSSASLLTAAVTQLGFTAGELLPASAAPSSVKGDVWVEKGDWLSLAQSVGADSVFFVDQAPVIVFAKTDNTATDLPAHIYNKVWCMARPQLLFLAIPGELAVYDLTKPPIRPGERIDAGGRLLSHKVQTIAAVQEKLAQFRREEIESGRVFGDDRFGVGTNRADIALVRDLQVVRNKLLQSGLNAKHAHAIIGRSIFIRYLEDRKVLVPSYFYNVAGVNHEWHDLMESRQNELFPRDLGSVQSHYLRVLGDRDFTYALFDQLAADFNGDIFPVDLEERKSVTAAHLELLRSLLSGEGTEQLRLFFFAYQFDIIPIELISSIYEEFYNTERGKDRNHGSHYTPSSLVDFVLSRVLTSKVLDSSPRVIDPACGSGIFIVECFRRMVRHLAHRQQGRRPSRPQLRRILRDQIAGIDINEEAIRVAAFSLYLAFLHYQEPREINEERRLPTLKWSGNNNGDADFNILLNGNAFDTFDSKRAPDIAKRFGPGSARIVVGNPPWGYPKDNDDLGRAALKKALDWCDERNKIIGDKELSQAFVHLALDLLPKGGKAGLLLSSGVLFKQHAKSRAFRKQWLSSSTLEQIVNFAHVRHVFFRGRTHKNESIAPFISAVFENEVPSRESRFAYWAAKKTALVENAQAVILSKADLHWLVQQDCIDRDDLWKIYWWGGHRDEALIRSIGRFTRLVDLPTMIEGANLFTDFGFVEGKKGQKPSGWLGKYKELPVKLFCSYGALPSQRATVPNRVRRRGTREAYEGHRVLIRRGIPSTGKLTVRLEKSKFCFRHSIFALRLEGLQSWQEQALLGILWSSLARYYLFLTAGSWGLWHDEINWESLKALPIALPQDREQRSRLLQIVDQLRHLGDKQFPSVRPETVRDLEKQLDDVIFDIYELNRAERDVIRDMCEVEIEFLYYDRQSRGAKPLTLSTEERGTQADITTKDEVLKDYLRTFLGIWSKDLGPKANLDWQILLPHADSDIIALYITPNISSSPGFEAASSWSSVLERIEKNQLHMEGSRRIYIDTFIRSIANEEIVIIKRNEQRFWTQTAAREDVEATQLQAMQLQELRAQNEW